MSEELIDLPPALEPITPEKGYGRRYSTGQTCFSVDGRKSVPHYLRASTGSCHDFCKYGRRHETEMKPWSSACRRKKIEGKPLEKLVTTNEVLPDRKNYRKAKPKSLSDGKGQLPDFSSANRQKVSTSEKRTLRSNEGKSKAISRLKSSATPTRLCNPGKTVKEQVSPDFEVSKLVSVKVTESRMPGKLATHSRTKALITKPTPSSKSPPSLGLRKMDRKVVENARIPNRIRVKNAVISSTSSTPSKSSVGFVQTLIKRQVWKQKTVIGQRNQKIAQDCGIQHSEEEVPEKTLYVIEVETNDISLNFGERNISMGVPSPSPSPSIAESSAWQNSSAILSHSEEKEGMERSRIQNSSHKEDDDNDDEEDVDVDDDEEGSEYPDDESDFYSTTELDDTENKEKEGISNGDGVKRRPRKEWMVHPGGDGNPVKLRFRRGRVVEIQSENDASQRLKFRHGRSLGENEDRIGTRRRSLKRREITVDNDDVADPSSEKYALRHSSVQEKKDVQGLFNNVIEETASKLVETRKSKVKALVGAFETVISLQDGNPSATEAN